MFKKKDQQSVPTTAVGLGAPIVVESGDLERVSALMVEFNRVFDTGGDIRSFGISFNRAGGFISDMNALDAQRDNPDALKRPWLWLAAVELEAAGQGQALLVAQIALMTRYWHNEVAPQLGMADWFDGVVDAISDSARAQIFAVALPVIANMPPDTVVMENATGSLNALDVLRLSAGEILTVENWIDPGVVASARTILHR
jgi:hypothetical protein